MFSAEDKASVLIEALPYIQKFYGKTIVVKYGGNAMVSDTLKEKVMEDIALLKYVGVRPVIIHGGGPEITGFLKKVGNLLNHRGVKAVGISGKDAGLIRAKKKLATVYDGDDAKKVDIGYVGEVEKVDTGLLDDLIDHDYIPVIAPIGVDEEGASYNINADYVAAEIAGALHAEKLLLLTDIEGVYKDYHDKDTFISTLHQAEAREYIKSGIIEGGMIPKIEACLKALDAGAVKAHIIDGRLAHSILLEVLTPQGIGTQVVR